MKVIQTTSICLIFSPVPPHNFNPHICLACSSPPPSSQTHESQQLWHLWQFMDRLTDVVITLIYSLVLNYKDLAAVDKAAYLSVR